MSEIVLAPLEDEVQPEQPADFNFTEVAGLLVRDLERLTEYSRELKLDNSISLISEVVKRLRNHRFCVAVVGEFKTGKSTFVNSLLGANIVPADVLPTTATLNRVTYGSERKIEVAYKTGKIDVIAFDRLNDYVTKEKVKGALLDSIEEVRIYHESPYLMNGVDIIDTPGLNDDETMTSITLSVLPKTDAAILVISALQPFSQYTSDFLQKHLLAADLGTVMFLVNRIDQIGSDEDADRVIEHIQRRIREQFLERVEKELGANTPQYDAYRRKLGRIKVYGMNSRGAMEGRSKSDAELTRRSRFPEFDLALKRFLNAERGVLALQIPVNRVLASSKEIALAINVRFESLKMDAASFDEKYTSSCAELAMLRERKQKELEIVDERHKEAIALGKQKLSGVDERTIVAIKSMVEAFPITDDEIASDKEAAGKRIFAAAMRLRNQLVNEELEAASFEINKVANEACERAAQFTEDVERTIKEISLNYSDADKRGGEVAVAATSAIVLSITSSLCVFGGVYAGYKQAGLKGAVTGGVTGMAASALTAGLLILLGAPLTIPVAIGLTFVGWLAGDKATRLIFKDDRAKNFKEAMYTQIKAHLKTVNMEGQLGSILETYAQENFLGLRTSLSREVQAVVENTQATLNDLKEMRARQTMENTGSAERYREVLNNIAAITQRADQLNQQLLKRLEA